MGVSDWKVIVNCCNGCKTMRLKAGIYVDGRVRFHRYHTEYGVDTDTGRIEVSSFKV